MQDHDDDLPPNVANPAEIDTGEVVLPAVPIPAAALNEARRCVQWRRLRARMLAARDALATTIHISTEERPVVDKILATKTWSDLDLYALAKGSAVEQIYSAQYRYVTAVEEYLGARQSLADAVAGREFTAAPGPEKYNDHNNPDLNKYRPEDFEAAGGEVINGELRCGALPTSRGIPCRQPVGPDLRCYWHR